MKKNIIWIPISVIAIIYVQALFFKFSGSEETTILFDTIAMWLHSALGMPLAFSNIFSSYGAYVVGTIELFIVLFIIARKTRIFGSTLNLGLISGALFVHTYTPVGIDRVIDNSGNTDGGVLFLMACLVAISTLSVLFFSFKRQNNTNQNTLLAQSV